MTRHLSQLRTSGFTIIELLVVIAIIGILATIVFVAYTGIQSTARNSSVLSDLDALDGIETQYGLKNSVAGKAWYSGTGVDPDLNFTPSSGNVIDVVINSTDYCIRVYNSNSATYKTLASAAIKESTPGVCASLDASAAAQSDSSGGGGGGGEFIQTITDVNCPNTRTRTVDARDNHTYWVKRLDDGKCWMLTNLAYAGGGTNTYGDIKTLTDGTVSAPTYTEASYYIPAAGSNVTTEPIAPSTSTNGGGQYGYLYNWCAAMGGQGSTGACTYAMTPYPDTNISVCPAGWRLPTANGGEYAALNTAINGGTGVAGNSTTSAGLLSTWLGQYAGYYWNGASTSATTRGDYWSATISDLGKAFPLEFGASSAVTNLSLNKRSGAAVRCIAS